MIQVTIRNDSEAPDHFARVLSFDPRASCAGSADMQLESQLSAGEAVVLFLDDARSLVVEMAEGGFE